jgi:FMN reductase
MSIVQPHPAGWFVERAANDVSAPIIVGIGGTIRDQSSSQKALQRCMHFAANLGARTFTITGTQMPVEIYDPSRQERSVEATRLVNLLRSADGVIIASPAYHGSISGHLKNALDYTEDMRGDAAPYLDGRAVGVICCAMGWQAGGATLGAMRSIVHALRGWPTPMGVLINSTEARFDESDRCSVPAIDDQLRIMAGQVFEFASRSFSTRAKSAAALAVPAE